MSRGQLPAKGPANSLREVTRPEVMIIAVRVQLKERWGLIFDHSTIIITCLPRQLLVKANKFL
jgi:hypothetical protein